MIGKAIRLLLGRAASLWPRLLSPWGLAGAFALGAAVAGGAAWKVSAAIHDADKVAALERALAQAHEIYQEDMALMAGSQQIVERIRTEVRYVEAEMGRVDTPDCTDLGPDWIRLHNQAAAAANRARTGSPAD